MPAPSTWKNPGTITSSQGQLEQRAAMLEQREAALIELESKLLEREMAVDRSEATNVASAAALLRERELLQGEQTLVAKQRQENAARDEREHKAMQGREQRLREDANALARDRETLRLERESFAREKDSFEHRRSLRESVQEQQPPPPPPPRAESAREDDLRLQLMMQPLQQMLQPLHQLAGPLNQLVMQRQQSQAPPPPQIVMMQPHQLASSYGDHGDSTHGGSAQLGASDNPGPTQGSHAPDKHKRGGQDPLDASNVPAIIDEFLREGAEVPIDVLVGEVEALQQASTRLRVNADRCKAQLEQLKDRKRRMDNIEREQKDIERKGGQVPPRDRIDGKQRAELKAKVEELSKEKERSERASAKLQERYERFRDRGVERFLPKLLTTVEKYDSVFEDCIMREHGEADLSEIRSLSESFLGVVSPDSEPQQTKGRDLRQICPSSSPPEAKQTLLRLLHMALTAYRPLLEIAQAACRHASAAAEPPKRYADNERSCDIRVLHSSAKTKGVRRCLAKAQEEYEGDYTRLLDLARCTILCTTISDVLSVLKFMLGMMPEKPQRFQACRIKDRLSRAWDAEVSGGNRDLLVNGWLDLGANKFLIVEVQIHLQPLFALKHDLHVLYAGARVLGAMDDLTIAWEGKLLSDDKSVRKTHGLGDTADSEADVLKMMHLNDESVLDKASRGILRKLGLSHSRMNEGHKEHVHKLLHQEPCPLITLDVSQCYRGEHNESGASTPTDGELASDPRRTGELPPSSPTGSSSDGSGSNDGKQRVPCFKGMSLEQLLTPPELLSTIAEDDVHPDTSTSLSSNTQMISCWRLRHLRLNGCGLTGTLPDSLRSCRQLQDLRVGSNQLNGPLPPWLFDAAILPKLKIIYLAYNDFDGTIPATFSTSNVSELFARETLLSGDVPACPPGLERLNLMKCCLTGLVDDCFKGCASLKEINIGKNAIGTIGVRWAPCDDGGQVGSRQSSLSPSAHGSMKLRLPATPTTGVELEHQALVERVAAKIAQRSTKKSHDKKTSAIATSVSLSKDELKDLRVDGLKPDSFIKVGDTYYRQDVTSVLFPSLASCTALEALFIDNNAFSGSMPTDLFEPFARTMLFFSIEVNQIEGSIPPSLRQCKCIKNATLQSNRLSGAIPPLPDCLGKLEAGDNHLSGRLPTLPTNLKKLEVPRNRLSGPTEPAFARHNLSAEAGRSRTNLEKIDVSGQTADTPLGPLPEALIALKGEIKIFS